MAEHPRIPLPKSWPTHVRAAILHVLELAQFATAYTRSWATNSSNARIRLKAEIDRAKQELALVREEVRIKNARMARLHPQRRPHDSPTERLAILEPSAARPTRTVKEPLHLGHGGDSCESKIESRFPVNDWGN